ncbi:MAG: ABC transporter permease [Candidatus Koribacter versatilis]|uniref:ABC transporter permease n=1 Tax=Candidatus Korobacter versatilis TaxID=658062 RepID=A0A932A8G5_9BACT|nr:ABC transporter permease [Candidatus Koribacter versatilis]
MFFFFKEIVVQGWQSLLRNRMRSLLTMLGIVWGLTSVVLLLGYGEGLGKEIIVADQGIGNAVIHLWGGQTSMQAGGQRAGKRVRFKYEDIDAIRDEVPSVKAVSAEADDTVGFKVGSRVVSNTVKAIDLPYGPMRRLDIEEGRYFNEADYVEHRHVMVLGPDAAKKIFGTQPALGLTATVQGQTFEVIGILRRKIQDSSNNCQDNSCVFMPYATVRDLLDMHDPDMILFQPVDRTQNKQTLLAVRTVLGRIHGFDPKDEKAVPDWDTIENSQEMRNFTLGLDVLLGLIGALTLGVGGVGVMNIMLVSVTERTREIGLRKALGARPRQILFQFLVEALVLTFLGGVVGMLVATALAYAIPPMPLYSDLYKTANSEGDILLRPSVMVMTVSFIVLALVGITSGFWPALKAAKMNPIEALRYE